MNTVLVWGTGSRAEMLLDMLDGAKCALIGFIDSNPEKQGRLFREHPVYSPERLPDLDYENLIVACAYSAEVLPHAASLGVPSEKIHLVSRTAPDFLSKFCTPSCCVPKDDLTLAEEINWYHRFELLPGFETNGRCPYNPAKLNYFEALKSPQGKTVLDIGAWDGPYTFEMERRGAQVTAFDIQDPDNSGFNLAKRIKESKAGHIMDNVYNLSPEKHGTYDIVLYLGVWYHLKNPVLALENIHSVLKPGGLLVFEGAILDHADNVDEYWRDKAHLLPGLLDEPFCWYSAEAYSEDDSNWSIPTAACVRSWLASTGFKTLSMDIKKADSRAWGAARRIDDFFRAEHGLV